MEWVERHVPLSFSVVSNVPRYEAPRCFVPDGDSNKLVAEMLRHLHAVSDAAFESLKPSHESVLEKCYGRVDSAEKECGIEGDENEDEVGEKEQDEPLQKAIGPVVQLATTVTRDRV